METRYKVLDTNIFLLGEPRKALLAFKPPREGIKTVLIIPHVVINELDKIKSEKINGRRTDRAKEAQNALKLLDHYIVRDPENYQNPVQGVRIEANYEFKYVNASEINPEIIKEVNASISDDNDAQIIKIALQYHRKNGDCEIISNDFGMRQRARLFELVANEWESLQDIKVQEEEFKGFKGYRELELPKEIINDFLRDGRIMVSLNSGYASIDKMVANEFCLIHEAGQEYKMLSALGIYNSKESSIIQLKDNKTNCAGITSNNSEQRFALEALMNYDIRLVHLIGPAGGGKTLLALAAAVEQSITNKAYETIRIVRPMISIGQEIGYLPGSEKEKIDPWMRAIYSALAILRLPADSNGRKSTRKDEPQAGRRLMKHDIDGFIESGKMILTPIYPVRGDTFRSCYMIIDESQNFTPDEIKTLLTRAGKGTKVIITGDPFQTDHPNLDTYSSGLVHSAERMKGLNYAATVYLSQGERSELATDASRRL